MSKWVAKIKRLLLKMHVFKCPAKQPQFENIILEGQSYN